MLPLLLLQPALASSLASSFPDGLLLLGLCPGRSASLTWSLGVYATALYVSGSITPQGSLSWLPCSGRVPLHTESPESCCSLVISVCGRNSLMNMLHWFTVQEAGFWWNLLTIVAPAPVGPGTRQQLTWGPSQLCCWGTDLGV